MTSPREDHTIHNLIFTGNILSHIDTSMTMITVHLQHKYLYNTSQHQFTRTKIVPEREEKEGKKLFKRFSPDNINYI